ncbi:sigma-70 family RNA polymerase sigma factor [Ekhidna sp.]|uniref:RNA polymerase sigma factor n=1 Tax=Ekhidna sp. TaxID=2608089 RepID=UPI0032EBDAF8
MGEKKIYPLDVHKASSLKKGKQRFSDRKDEEIWQAYCAGDDEAFVYIYNEYVHRLFTFGVQFASRAIVLDAIQDLFLYLKQRQGKEQRVEKIRPYLYKALHRTLMSILKKETRLKSFEPSNDPPANWAISLTSDVKLIDEENTKIQRGRLTKALNQLSEKQRQAIILYYYEGFTFEEIKDIMNVSDKSSARKLVGRALDSMRHIFV